MERRVEFAIDVHADTDREAAEKAWEMLNNLPCLPVATVLTEDGPVNIDLNEDEEDA